MGTTSLQFANIPGSHAPAPCFVVWGIYFLLCWWQSGRLHLGLAAGFLLGFAVTIRYTERFLLFPLYPLDQVLADTTISSAHPHLWLLLKIIRFLPIGPLGIAVLLSIRWKNLRSYFHAAVPIISWTIPVGILVTFNWFSLGHLTGYDATNESVGFSTTEFLRKWDFTIYQIYVFGLFLFMPLGIAGLVLMFRNSWRIALLLTFWFVPGALLYTAYYWGCKCPASHFCDSFSRCFRR